MVGELEIQELSETQEKTIYSQTVGLRAVSGQSSELRQGYSLQVSHFLKLSPDTVATNTWRIANGKGRLERQTQITHAFV